MSEEGKVYHGGRSLTDFKLDHDEHGALCVFFIDNSKRKPLKVDFIAGNFARRIKTSLGLNEPLARALDLHPGNRIIDATAGFGRESMLIAQLGAEVILIEQSPIMAALLKDGIRRAIQDETLSQTVSKLQLIEGDALQYIPTLCKDIQIDAIYLDPMFPERTKSAAVKKEMQFLHHIVKHQEEQDTLLLMCALKANTRRVVVKRPKKASPLGNIKANHVILAGAMRFDVYLNVNNP